jgi:hypothetical protein
MNKLTMDDQYRLYRQKDNQNTNVRDALEENQKQNKSYDSYNNNKSNSIKGIEEYQKAHLVKLESEREIDPNTIVNIPIRTQN